MYTPIYVFCPYSTWWLRLLRSMTPLTTLIIPTTLNLFLCVHRRYWMYTCFYISVLYPYFTLLSILFTLLSSLSLLSLPLLLFNSNLFQETRLAREVAAWRELTLSIAMTIIMILKLVILLLLINAFAATFWALRREVRTMMMIMMKVRMLMRDVYLVYYYIYSPNSLFN